MADSQPIDIIRSRELEDANSERRAQYRRDEPQDPSPQQGEQKSANAEARYDEDALPPDGGYGWVCVACVFWINAHTWGINSVSFPCWIGQETSILMISHRAMASSCPGISHITYSQIPLPWHMRSPVVSAYPAPY